MPLFAASAFVGSGWFLDSSQLAGVALATFAAGNVAAVLIFSRRSDRFGRRRPIILGLMISAVATGLLGLAPSPLVLLLLSVIAGAGTGLMNPAQQAAIADIVGSGRNGGSVVSTFQMTQDLGSIVGPLLAGFPGGPAGLRLGLRRHRGDPDVRGAGLDTGPGDLGDPGGAGRARADLTGPVARETQEAGSGPPSISLDGPDPGFFGETENRDLGGRHSRGAPAVVLLAPLTVSKM